MKRSLILILILLLVACGQIDAYDKYTRSWKLDLPRPSSYSPGKLTDGRIRDYQDFDLVFSYGDDVNLDALDFWKTLGDEERYELILKLYERYGLDLGSTVEDKKAVLEDYLDLDLGPSLKIFFKNTGRENILLLKKKAPGELLMVRVMN